MFFNKYRLKFLIPLMVIIGFFGALVYNYNLSDRGNNKQFQNDKESRFSIEEIGVITEDTSLKFITKYKDCDHFLIEEKRPEEFYLGLNFNQIQEIYANWEITEFNSDQVIFKLKKEGLCPEHYYVGIYNSQVAIFHNNGNLKEITDINVNLLREDVKIKLNEGIEVYGNEELLKLIEGLSK